MTVQQPHKTVDSTVDDMTLGCIGYIDLCTSDRQQTLEAEPGCALIRHFQRP